jgi:hypothetical protein
MTSVFYEKFIKGQLVEQQSSIVDDNVNSPSHYTSGGIETIDYMEAKSTHEEFCGHLRLTTIKYLSRAGLKDDEIQDLEKAAWYLNKLIKVRKDHGNTK